MSMQAVKNNNSMDDNLKSDDAAAPPPAARTTRKRTVKPQNDDDLEPPKTKRTAAKKIAAADKATAESTASIDDATEEQPLENVATAKKKAPRHQVLTERDELPRLWNSALAAANGSYTFRIASWNVAGLRAVLNKTPNAFAELAAKHDLDVLCLQETKLQEQHLVDPKLKIRESMALPGYDDYWTCSTAKKGYSGTAVFVRRRLTEDDATKKMNVSKQSTLDSFVIVGSKGKGSTTTSNAMVEVLPIAEKLLMPEQVSYTLGHDKHDAEGRIVMLDYPLFSLCNVYIPNAGQKLERLSYRTDEWDKDFFAVMQQKQKNRGVPVLWLGDLNVAHTHLEVWNDGAKHLSKQAGVTPEERASFQAQLDAGFVDAFRRLHPTAAGHYSYWSMRAGNRAPNKGLRLDYFICDHALFDDNSQVTVRDSYMDYDQEGSDHCPVILELEIKK